METVNNKNITKERKKPNFKVKVFVNDKEVNSSDLPDYQIKRPAIDRIANDIKDRAPDDNLVNN